ncbi:claudin-10-like [Anabas testudineus]|uniref:Uncharacterized protein n=1 Tax=Anabas testudineus TaxID=64144 RepID=A0A3Q1JWX8_ANATE|nr:claudin-10-like [Anabas testudineus]
MGYRTVVMYMEIGCFVVCISGWILVCSTMPTEIWSWSEVESSALTTAHYFSNLWKDCVTDSTGLSDCKGIPSLLALNWGIHMCRALVITSIILAFFGSVLVLVGMKCTKIGGSEYAKSRVTFAGGMNYFIGGLCSMIAFSFYGNRIRAEFQDPYFKSTKFEIGVGVFLGWAGSTLLIVGGLIYSIFGGREGCQSSSEINSPAYRMPGAYTMVSKNKSNVSLAHTEISENRKSRTTRNSKGSSIYATRNDANTTAINAYV